MGQCHICVGRLTMEACPCRDRPAVHCASSTLYTLISRGELSRDCALRPFAFGSLALRAAAAPAAVYQLSRSLLHSSWLPVPPGAATPARSRRQGGTGGEGGSRHGREAKFQTAPVPAPVPATALRHNLLTQRLMASQNLAASYVMPSVQLHI